MIVDGIRTGLPARAWDEPGGCPGVLARWCPAYRWREPGLRRPHGTAEGWPGYCPLQGARGSPPSVVMA